MTRSSRTLRFAAILAAGLAFAPIAHAQESQSFAYSTSGGDGTSIDLEIRDGRVAVARVNGEEIAPDRIREVEGGYEILAEDGTVMRRIEARGVPRVPPAAGARPRTAGQPKSMIGVGLGAPDEALAHHLGIDRSRSTMVTSVAKELPAAKAGIERFDVIVAVNGDRNASSDALRRVLREVEPGAKVSLEIRRGDKTKTVEVVASAFDGDKLAVEVEGMPLPPGWSGDEAPMDAVVENDETVMFFMGPDGRRREIRVPGLAVRPDELRGLDIEGLEGRMADWSERFERRMREGQAEGGPQADRRPRAPQPQREGGPDRQEERLRRIEDRLEQLMRELERDRAERRGRENDA